MYELVRFKQHRHMRSRNEHEQDTMYQYQLIFHPISKQFYYEDLISKDIESKGGSWNWEDQIKENLGELPEMYKCWCEYYADFLVIQGFRWKGAAAERGCEIWVKDE